MTKAGGVYVCILILALEIEAGILSGQGKVQENKVKPLRMWIFDCKEPSQGAFNLGLGAVVYCARRTCSRTCWAAPTTAFAPRRTFRRPLQAGSTRWPAHSSPGQAKKCPLRSRSSHFHEIKGKRFKSHVGCGVALAMGLSMLVIGTLSNEKSRASCSFSQHHFMWKGGIACFVHGLFSIVLLRFCHFRLSDLNISKVEGRFDG